MQELTELFTVERVHSSPARFDMKKLEAINGDKIRELTLDELLKRTTPFLIKDGVITGTPGELEVVKSALPIIQERIATLAEVSQMLKFLFATKFAVDSEELAKIQDEQAQVVLKKSNEVLQKLENWDHESIHVALKSALIEELGLKPRVAFGAVRIAVTGSHISPPLFESMELLGRTRSLERIAGSIS
jgi:glutamyl-tRNA synthetase